MTFIKNNYKNIIIFILLILFITASFIIFKLLNEQKIETLQISGKVIISDSKYVIISKDNENYLIENIKGSYDIGDEVTFTYDSNKLNNEESPTRIIIKDEELIKKVENLSSEEATIEDIETENNDNPTIKPNTNYTSVDNKPNEITSNNQDEIDNISNADTEVMNYFTNLQNEMNKESIGKTAKEGFITVVDFLFYNGTIKGHTFNELSSTVKLKVLSMALYFDSKIEKYFPGYKESISNTANKIYTNIKEKVVSAYLNLTTTICTNDRELCLQAKEGFTELKTNFGLTFDFLKDIAGDGITNLKSWYEIWSGKY